MKLKPLNIPVNVGVSGHFKMVAVKPDGTERFLAEFDNLITDIGLNRLGTGNAATWLQVGSGNATPLVSNTALANRIAGTSTVGLNTWVNPAGSAPYFGTQRRRFDFAIGAAAGNLSEVGVGWATSGSLFSRALILDAFGDPTSITVLADEILQVTYDCRLYAPVGDTNFDLTIGGVVHACVLRAAGANQIYWHGYGVLDAAPQMYVTPYAGPIGTELQIPSGTQGSGKQAVADPYVNNSLQRTALLSYGLAEGNISGGIGAMLITHDTSGQYPFGAFQVSFNPKIQKDNTKLFTMNFVRTWSRYTP